MSYKVVFYKFFVGIKSLSVILLVFKYVLCIKDKTGSPVLFESPKYLYNL